MDESFAPSKKIKGTLSVSLSWSGIDDNNTSPSKKEGKSEQTTMRKYNYDGVYKLTILSGTSNENKKLSLNDRSI